MARYRIYRYYGGEHPPDVIEADTYKEAEKLAMAAEHWEIEEIIKTLKSIDEVWDIGEHKEFEL